MTGRVIENQAKIWKCPDNCKPNKRGCTKGILVLRSTSFFIKALCRWLEQYFSHRRIWKHKSYEMRFKSGVLPSNVIFGSLLFDDVLYRTFLGWLCWYRVTGQLTFSIKLQQKMHTSMKFLMVYVFLWHTHRNADFFHK